MHCPAKFYPLLLGLHAYTLKDVACKGVSRKVAGDSCSDSDGDNVFGYGGGGVVIVVVVVAAVVVLAVVEWRGSVVVGRQAILKGTNEIYEVFAVEARTNSDAITNTYPGISTPKLPSKLAVDFYQSSKLKVVQPWKHIPKYFYITIQYLEEGRMQ